MLLADLCRQLRIADAAPLLRDGRLVVDNIETALAHEHGRDGEHLWMCVDFGAVPDDGALRVYRAMLQANLLAGGMERGMFTLQASGRVALVVRRPLTPEFDGERLARTLLGHADLAKGWIAGVVGAADGGVRA